ncbi:MAG: ATP-dependent Clp protease ATP-binding subunit ClpC [Candidatus Komeilibacteria bacterium CG_4_10_14_0_2_um_filter_37_10]|uniref:ATP-dependent Clp protease ATP-binding subunit ClpC n=1 Tax=Candidatus Komeilibacteria bacterium CG_4_10_14_0_2_um_filter_37_10 TaxID=1974470 RepID=A0A2M7VFQ0_9BACT|nr:MAG: ATP-dependent Clp protease ATP-binding subunit ClpC [Candidatus Komeilibacteria bacterium CG_4_10_14_0_2_um_filter_37_10]
MNNIYDNINNFGDTFEHFSNHFKKVLVTAQELAINLRNQSVEPLHLLYALSIEKGSIAADILAKNKFTSTEAKDILVVLGDHHNINDGLPTLTASTQKIIEKSATLAYENNHRYIGTEHLLASLASSPDANLLKLLGSKGISLSAIKEHVLTILKSTSKFGDLTSQQNKNNQDGFTGDNELEKILLGQEKQEMNLSSFTTDLTDEDVQKEIDPVIGREAEIDRLIQILSRRTKNNPIVLGDPGVGKTAIIEGLAKRITKGQVPDVLINKKILSLDLGSTIAGTMYRGEFEKRVKNIVEEIKKNKNIILFIDEIHNLMGAGATGGSLDAANILKPELARGHLRCIGATTMEEYKKHIESDPAFERRFQPIIIKESTREEAIAILVGLKENYEKYHGVTITAEAVTAAVDLSIRYLQDKYLPDKAIDLIDEAASKLKVEATRDGRAKKIKKLQDNIKQIIKDKETAIQQENFNQALIIKDKENDLNKQLDKLTIDSERVSHKNLGQITATEIKLVISRMTRIPLKDLALDEKNRLLNLENELAKYIIGQDEALQALAQSIRRSQTGLGNPNRPIGSFIFLGPSGIGKTETAKVLAREFFGRNDALIRVDMSEFAESFNISKLIGAPAGYVGYKDKGTLTDRVKHQPYSVVLFDEIEKAHPDVFNLLLPILEDGHLTDAGGKIINFKNTIIILTSNIGLSEFNQQVQLGFDIEQQKEQELLSKYQELSVKILADLKEYFRPEFLNRIDDTIIFKPLSKKDMLKIAKLQISELLSRLLKQKLQAQISTKTFNFIVEKGFSSEQGARGIRRAIQDYLEVPLANKLLSDPLTENSMIKISVNKDKILVN